MSQKRKELQKNELADALENKLEQIRPYTNYILVGAVVVVVGIGAIFYFVAQTRKTNEARWNDFFIAQNSSLVTGSTKELINESETHSGTPAGMWALQLAADQTLGEGVRTMYSDRAAGVEKVEEAIGMYNEILDASDRKEMIWQSAQFGRAQAYESVFDIEKARADYQALIDSFGSEADSPSALGMAAERRIGLLDMEGLAAFGEQFVNHTPGSAASVLPGGPGALEGPLPPIPNISFPEPMTTIENNTSNNEGLVNPESGETSDGSGGQTQPELVIPGTVDPAKGDTTTGNDQNTGDGNTGDGNTGGGDSQGGGNTDSTGDNGSDSNNGN